jgi:hypothetical protein
MVTQVPRFVSFCTFFFLVTLVAGAPPIFSKRIGRHLLNTTEGVESVGQLYELPAAVNYKSLRTRQNHHKDLRQHHSSDLDGIVQQIMDKNKNQTYFKTNTTNVAMSITSTTDNPTVPDTHKEWETNTLTLLTLVEQALNLMRITLTNAHHP